LGPLSLPKLKSHGHQGINTGLQSLQEVKHESSCSDRSSNSSARPPSNYQAYQKLKKGKSERKLLKQNTQTIKKMMLEQNQNSIYDQAKPSNESL